MIAVGWVEARADTHRFYRWRFAGDVVLLQVGRFFEFCTKHDDEIARTLDLKPMGKNSRRARYGFPVRVAARYIKQLLRTERSVAVILERDVYLTSVRLRAPAWRIERAGCRS